LLALELGQPPKTECVTLDHDLLLADSIIFGLRMNRGVDLKSINERFPTASNRAELEGQLKIFEREGLLRSQGSQYALTHRGRLVCDAIGSALLEV